MGRPRLLVKATPTKARSIEARQHSGIDTTVEYTHALQGTETREGIQKTRRFSVIALANKTFGGNAKRRVLEGGSSMRTRMKQATMEHMNVN